MKPYVGVTGCMTPQEARALSRHFTDVFDESDLPHDLMIGVLASQQSLRGMKNAYHRQPAAERIAEIFQPLPRVFNVLHYHENLGEDDSTLAYRLAEITRSWCGPHLHGIQLNMVWPGSSMLEDFHMKTGRKYRIILQLNRLALEEKEFDVRRVTTEVAAYWKLIDAVLVDQSGGKGRFLDVPYTLSLLDALKRHVPHLQCIVAGGLDAGTVSFLRSLVRHHPNVGLDTETNVRVQPDDDLDLEAACAYIESAHALYTYKPDTFSLSV